MGEKHAQFCLGHGEEVGVYERDGRERLTRDVLEQDGKRQSTCFTAAAIRAHSHPFLPSSQVESFMNSNMDPFVPTGSKTQLEDQISPSG